MAARAAALIAAMAAALLGMASGAQAATPATPAAPAAPAAATAEPQGATALPAKPAAGAAPPPLVVPDTLAQRLQPCMACHGREGRASRSGYLPRIAGKPAGYLYNQLLNFRDGRRANATMADLLAHQTDAYLAEMAGHFAAQDLPYPPPDAPASPPALLARGEALVREGDARRQLPACAACHGQRLTGRLPAVPGLLGLPRDYLIGQLGAWQTGGRHALAPDCMAQVVQRLDAADIGAVASWLAAQPVPSPATPTPATTPGQPLPLRCGPDAPAASTAPAPAASSLAAHPPSARPVAGSTPSARGTRSAP